MSIRTICVMGCGGHVVTGHLPFLQGARVVGIYDPEPASRRAARRALGYTPQTFRTIKGLLRAKPDGVIIGSPDPYHPEQLAEAVAAGIPVLCEKPLAADADGLNTVRAALQTAQTNQTMVASCHQRRSAIVDLPYGWVRANLPKLQQRFGPLRAVRLNSNYPQPQRAWKHNRSFLADKFVHDIDYLRILLGNGAFRLQRRFDNYDHYLVTGRMAYGGSNVELVCEGTRLHNDRGAFIEYILLSFKNGECVVYTKPGVVRYYDRRTDQKSDGRITGMISPSYDRLNREVTHNFLNGVAVHTPSDLLINTAAVVALAGPQGLYRLR